MAYKYAIFDLDNCLSNDAWRIPTINWNLSDLDRRYADYHSLSPFDEPGNKWFYDGCAMELGIIISTARPITQFAATAEWFRRKMSRQPDIFLMRNVGDFRKSVDLKSVHLDWLENHYGIHLEHIMHAVDDRVDVVDMYRARGISAHVMNIHDVCAYTPQPPYTESPDPSTIQSVDTRLPNPSTIQSNVTNASR